MTVVSGFKGVNITSIIIPDTISVIQANAFDECSKLESIVIPDSVTKIGDFAFRSCSSLTDIIIPDSVTSIGDYAFSSSGLVNVTIGSGVKGIWFKCFINCRKLSKVILTTNIKILSERAFANINSLTIYYMGTEEEWQKIEKDYYTFEDTRYKIEYNYKG